MKILAVAISIFSIHAVNAETFPVDRDCFQDGYCQKYSSSRMASVSRLGQGYDPRERSAPYQSPRAGADYCMRGNTDETTTSLKPTVQYQIYTTKTYYSEFDPEEGFFVTVHFLSTVSTQKKMLISPTMHPTAARDRSEAPDFFVEHCGSSYVSAIIYGGDLEGKIRLKKNISFELNETPKTLAELLKRIDEIQNLLTGKVTGSGLSVPSELANEAWWNLSLAEKYSVFEIFFLAGKGDLHRIGAEATTYP